QRGAGHHDRVVPRLPALLRHQARTPHSTAGRPRATGGTRGHHLDAVRRAGRTTLTRPSHPAAARACRTPGRPGDPGPLFTTAAACKSLAEAGAPATDPDRAWEAVRTLEDTGLLTIDSAATPPVARVSRTVASLAGPPCPSRCCSGRRKRPRTRCW